MATDTDNFTPTALALLDAFVAQRAGLSPADYGNWSAYRSDSRSITRDLHHYRAIRGAVHWRTFTLAQWQDAFRNAYSGRLTLQHVTAEYGDVKQDKGWRLSYCTGQYFPTEYRRAACAVLAALLWADRRENLPGENSCRRRAIGAEKPAQSFEYMTVSGAWVPVGTWMRDSFRREFGRTIAQRWFS